ncbi:hypothetical protein [Streptomyces sp. NPDC007264]|uniref:hypothetical protein n=1 Tax=Streptomyces sp. NPDC007264 TaxID=3364777 RepID=UPI0036DDA4A8
MAVELERLRGTVATNFAEVKGSLAVLVEQSNRNKEDVRQLREDTEKDIGELRTEVESLKRGRWPMPTIGVLAGVAGAATGAVALFAR